MNHAQLHQALKTLERELPMLRADGDFRPRFEAQVARLSAAAEDPDDAVYVIERADTMLGDVMFDDVVPAGVMPADVVPDGIKAGEVMRGDATPGDFAIAAAGD